MIAVEGSGIRIMSGLTDALPAGDRGAVEALAVFEDTSSTTRVGTVVLFLAPLGVREAEVDVLDLPFP